MSEQSSSQPNGIGRFFLPALTFAILASAIFAVSIHIKNSSSNSATGVVINVTADTYEREVLQSATPVIVEISSSERGACVAEEPVFKKLSAKFAGKLKFVRIDEQNEPTLVRDLGISRELTVMLPIHVVVKHAQPVIRMPGYLNEEELETVIEKGLARPPKLI